MREFGAESEEEFQKIIFNAWNITQCTRCGKMIDLTNCSFDDDDPICLHGCNYG